MDEYCGYDVEDVHSGTELDEVMCETCGTIQPATNRFCSHCGEDLKKGIVKVKDKGNAKAVCVFVVFVINIVLIMVAASVINNMISENERKKEETSIEIPEISIPEISIPEIEIPDIEIPDLYEEGIGYPEGKYVAGEDIPIGEYIVISDNFGCDSIEDMPYFVVNDGERNLHFNFFNSFYVTLESGYTLETEDCTVYPIGRCPVDNTPFENQGVFKVGVDMEAGIYSVIPLDVEMNGSYWIFDSLEDYHNMSYLVESGDVPIAGAEIELKEGQYLQLDFSRLEKNK